VKQLFMAGMLLVCLGATTAQAQDRGGFRVGVNAATLSTDEQGFDPKTRWGLVLGAFGVIPVNDMFAIQPEVLYSQQGAKVEDGSDKATVKLDFVQIPILARIRLGKGSPAHLLVGPSFGIRTKAETEFNGQSESFADEVKKGETSIVTGVAVNCGPAVVDARYNWGLTNLDKSSDAGKSRSRVFSASVGLRF